jgi:hypothetical protein
MNHATRSLVSAIAAIKVPKIYLFRSFFITLTLNVFFKGVRAKKPEAEKKEESFLY